MPLPADKAAEQLCRPGDPAGALEILDAAVRANAGDPGLHDRRCVVLQDLGRAREALHAGRRAVLLDPANAAAHAHLGGAHRHARQYDEALAELAVALQIDPGCAEAHAQRGLVLRQLGLPGDAIIAHRQALALGADGAQAWNGIGLCLRDGADAAGAMTAFRRALAASPAHAQARFNLQACAPLDPSQTAAQLRALAGHPRPAGEAAKRAPALLPDPDRVLRIGYLSAHFHHHPVGWLLRDVLRRHDSHRVDVHCYASQAERDALTEEMIGIAPHWAFVRALSDEALARRIRADGIDILVELSGDAEGSRLGVFAHRAAPVQAGWLGHGRCAGVRGRDAILLGREQATPGAASFFTEPVVTLDCCPFAYVAPDYAPEPAAPAPRDPVFGCFGGLASLNGAVLDAWCAILLALPASRLVLKDAGLNDPLVRDSLQRRFASRGVGAGRVGFRGPVPHRDLLAEHADLDVALDPFPGSVALATCEALWMGVPVVTLAWQRPASRESASVLRAVGLEDLVARSPRDYVSKALGLAADPGRRAALRGQLRGMMRASELGDGRAIARELENAYHLLCEPRGAAA